MRLPAFAVQSVLVALTLLTSAVPARAQDVKAVSADRLAAKVQALEDRDAIRALLVSYASTLDGRDFAGFEQLWARDAEFVGGANDRAKGPAAIRDLLQSLLKVNAAPEPGRDFHLVMNQTVDVTGDTATGFSRGTWVVTDPDRKLRISIIANYYDQFVREDGRWKFKRHQIGGTPPAAPAANAQAQRGPAAPAVPQMRGDGPPPEAKPFSITRADPALDDVISPQATLVELARGFGLTEGGLWIPEGNTGYWIFTGLLDNVLYKVTPQKQVSVFMERAGYTGTDPDHVGTQTRSGRSHVLLIGPSCTGMDHQGRVIWCADNDRQVMRLEKDGSHTVLSGGMNGQKFSGPNDIAIAADDAVYVTDNDFGLRDGGRNPDKQLQNGIYRIKDGKTTLVLSGSDLGGIPNGIALSPDGKWMYLTTANRQVRRYAVNPDGTVGAFTVFTEGVGIGDGMKTDTAGNLYSTSGAGPGIVRITSPAGKLLGTINLPIYGGEPKRQICSTNEAFGGADGRTLFIAGCDSVYTIQLKTPGIVPAHTVK